MATSVRTKNGSPRPRPALALAAGGVVEEFARRRARARARRAVCRDRAGIGRVDEGEPAGGIARPYRRWQRIDEGALRFGRGLQFLKMVQQFGEFLLETAHIGELEHRAAADRAPLGRYVLADRRGERDGKAFALPEQPIDRGLKRQRPRPARSHAV